MHGATTLRGNWGQSALLKNGFKTEKTGRNFCPFFGATDNVKFELFYEVEIVLLQFSTLQGQFQLDGFQAVREKRYM